MSTTATSTDVTPSPPRTSRTRAIWLLNAGLAALCAALVVGFVGGYEAIAPHAWAPWWGLAVAAAVTERWPVNIEFRRGAHSFSLTDIPATLALVFVSGTMGMLAMAVGAGVALALRRLPLIKFAFNMAQFLCAVALGYVVLHAVAGAQPEFGWRVWLGALLGLQAGGVLTTIALGWAVTLAEGRLNRHEVRQMFVMDAVVTATNTSLALVLAVILVLEPSASPLLAIPIVIAFVSYRAYVAGRQRHEKLVFLYEANRDLAESREVAHALVGLLRRALEAYRSERAEVLLFSADGTNPVLRTSLSSHDEEHMAAFDHSGVEALRALLAEHGGPVVLEEPLPPAARAYLSSRGIHNAMVAELRGEARTVGLLILANRTGFARRFTDDDLALFDTLADNASTALQYDRLEQAVSELSQLQERLHHQAYHDPLTGLANRSLFHQEVEKALSTHADAAVLFIDLDDFKGVNDTLGHAMGDRLLRSAARRLAGCVREDDVVARLGGDEFAVLCMDDRDAEAVGIGMAERLLEAFEMPLAVASRVLPVTLSVGIATSRHSGALVDPLLRDADVAMYQAKESGKGRYAVFDPDMREAILGRMGLKGELEDAIAHDRLSVHFQPIVDMRTGEVTGAEALVRWQHPTRGLLAPAAFIPLAEETGLIVPLGRRVLEHACREAAGWPHGSRPVDVQVNLCAKELEDDALIPTVTRVLRTTGLAPSRLVLEITESLLVRDAVRGAKTLSALRELGVKLALDDFGTGYSSLSYLRSLPLDVLKIAKEFVDGIADNPSDAAFMRLIVELAGTVGLTVVAEGVETSAQVEVLRELGCDQGQGYVFARPIPAEKWDPQGFSPTV